MNDREQFVLEIATNARARVNQYIREDQQLPVYEYGQRVSVEGRARPPRNYGNEGSFDIEGYLAARSIYWTITARKVELEEGFCGNKLLSFIYQMRGRILHRIESLFDSESAPRIAALLIGESAKLDRDWTDNFRRTGTYHALVVSGTHVTLLAGTFFLLLRWLFIHELTALFLTSVMTWVYAIIAGGSPPAMRAAAGFTLFLFCRFLYRKGRLLNILAVVAWCFVLYDPASLYDASFQLSFGAIVAIGGIAIPLDDRFIQPVRLALFRLPDRKRDPRLDPRVSSTRVELRLIAETIHLYTKIPLTCCLHLIRFTLAPFVFLLSLMIVSAAIQFSLAVLFVTYFQRFAFTAIIANLGVALCLEAAIVAGTLALTGFPPLVNLTQWLVNTASWLASAYASWEPALRIPTPPEWLMLLITLSISLLIWSFRVRRQIIPALMISLCLFVLLLLHPFHAETHDGKLELTAIDVGQGESLFLFFPDGTKMIIDSGGIPHFGRAAKPMDIGEAVVSTYLWSRSIRNIDILVLTHGHIDHMGGMGALIENFHPRELWISGRGKNAAMEDLFQKATSYGVTIRQLNYGDEVQKGETLIRVVSPPPWMKNTGEPRNNDSLGLKVSFGKHQFLLAGDAERRIEDELAFDESIGRIDVLKVSHHGGKTSTTDLLLSRTQPSFAMISAGLWNRYGHPHPEVIARLTRQRIATLRTDLNGRITILSDGKTLSMDTYRWSRTR